MGPIRHIGFDKDGVLIDVHHYWASVTLLRAERLVERFGLPSTWMDALARGMGADVAVRRVLRGGPVGYQPRRAVAEGAARVLAEATGTGENVDQVLSTFGEVDQDTGGRLPDLVLPLPGVPGALRDLRAAGIALSVVTSDRTALAEQALSLLGIRDLFDAVIGGDRVATPKPSPEGFLAACALVGESPENSAYVGDTLGDMEVGLNAGSRRVGVLTGLADAAELSTMADLVIADLTLLERHVPWTFDHP